jgi:hypothetical protein
MQLETLVAASVALVAFSAYLTHNRTGLPRVGKAGPVGFILTALRSIGSFEDLIKEGLNKYGGKPFVVPTMAGSVIMVSGPENIDLIEASDDSAVSSLGFYMPQQFDIFSQINQPIALEDV